MRKVIWFSRHEPTPAQVSDMGQTDAPEAVRLIKLTDLASKTLDSDEDVDSVMDAIREHRADAVYGVFPPAIQSEITRESMALAQDFGPHTHFHGAWNVNRAEEGERPSFEHLRFVVVGCIRR